MTESSAAALIRAVDLVPQGPVMWGQPVPCASPGVYVIETAAPLASAPIEPSAVAAWIEYVSTLRVDGERPSETALRERLASFWIPNETIVYAGLAGTAVDQRVGQFYGTPLGERRPHAGGHWLKTLANLQDLLVWWAVTAEPEVAEAALFEAFSRRHGGGLVLPFANRQVNAGIRKPHGITGSTLKRSAASRLADEPIPRGRRRTTTLDLSAINAALQRFACADPSGEVRAVEAARELDRRGLLKDSPVSPGLPLRDLLRAGRIQHAYQESNRWFIRCAGRPPL